MNFISLLLPLALSLSRVADQERKFVGDDTPLFVSRYQSVANLWSYRFAIPIQELFQISLIGSHRVNGHFDRRMLQEVHPLLLFPTFSGNSFKNNCFPTVKLEDYTRSGEPFDLNVVLDEVIAAFREKRDINYAGLAARFSLLHTMMALEDYVKDFDDSIFVDKTDDRLLAIRKLKEDLDVMALQIYGRDKVSLETMTSSSDNFLYASAQFNNYSGLVPLINELTTNDRFWSVMKPLLSKYDRMKMLGDITLQIDTLPFPVANLPFLAELKAEFPGEEISMGLAKSLPCDFFQAIMAPGQLKPFVIGQFKADAADMTDYLMSNDPAKINASFLDRQDLSKPWKVFLARRLLEISTEFQPQLDVYNLERLGVPKKDLLRAFEKGTIEDRFQYLPKYQQDLAYLTNPIPTQ